MLNMRAVQMIGCSNTVQIYIQFASLDMTQDDPVNLKQSQ